MADELNERTMQADLAAMGLTQAEWDKEWAEALEEGRRELSDETVIVRAAYDQISRRIVIDLAGGMSILVPSASLQALAGASPEELSEIEILGSHSLDWPRIDQQVYIPDLLRGITGTRSWMAAQLGRKGGSMKSAKKAASSRANGKLGGRPRKSKPAS